MQADTTRERLIAQTYGCLLGTSDWADFLREVATLLPDGRAILLHHDGRSQGSFINLHANVPEAMSGAYNAHFSRINPWMPAASRRPVGVPTQTSAMLSSEALRRTEFHADFLKPLGIREGVGLTVERCGDLNFNLSIIGADDRAAVVDQALATLQAIAPHLRQAFAFVRKAAAGSSAPDGPVLEAMLGIGIVRIGAHGVVQSANPAATAILHDRTGIRVDAGGRVTSRHAGLAAALDALRSVWRPFNGDTGARRWLVPRDDGRLPLQVTLVEVARGAVEGFLLGPEALLILEDAERGHVPVAEVGQHFGLTAAETRILSALVDGANLTATGQALGLSVTTARWHLKNIFAKTGCASQPELMRLVSRLTSIAPRS